MISADNTCIRCGAWRVDARDEEAELLEVMQERERRTVARWAVALGVCFASGVVVGLGALWIA